MIVDIDLKSISKEILQELYSYFHKINKDSKENRELDILLDYLIDQKIELEDLLYTFSKSETYRDTILEKIIKVMDYDTIYEAINNGGNEYFSNVHTVWITRNKKTLAFNINLYNSIYYMRKDELFVVILENDKIKIVDNIKKSDARYIPIK